MEMTPSIPAQKEPVSQMKAKNRDKFIHLTKRGHVSIWNALLIRVGAVLLALIVAGVITSLLTKENPLSVYAAYFEGAFGNENYTWFTIQQTAMLLCVSIAVTPAFRMRFWNTGAEGQVLISALATAMIMFFFGGKVSGFVLVLLMVTASIGAGMIWAVIPAFFKAHWNTNETLFTLMMNYIAIKLIETFLASADASGSNTVGPSVLKHGWFPAIFGKQYLMNILLVALATVAVWVYMKYSKHGYEISVVGESQNTARYIGINVKHVMIRTMAISGALCGLCGLILVAGTSHSIDPNLAAGRGFTAIMVSWLSKFNPITMVGVSFFIVFLQRGAGAVSTNFGLNSAFSDIITGILLFFIIGCEFFISYRINFNPNHKVSLFFSSVKKKITAPFSKGKESQQED